LKASKKKQIIILTAGKVGSITMLRSLSAALEAKEYFIQHDHKVNIGYDQRPTTLKERYKKNKNKTEWFFILGIRDPIRCHISACFQNNTYKTNSQINKSSTMWWTEYIDNVYHKELGMDLYQYTFDKQLGYSVIKIQDNIKVLIYKLDMLNEIFSQAIEKLLNISNIELKKDNITSEKGNEIKKDYKEAIQNTKVKKSEIDQIYSTKFVKHFFTDTEIENMKKKWQL